MQESQARKRKAGPQSPDYAATEDKKYQSDERRHSSGIPRFLPFIILFAFSFALYQFPERARQAVRGLLGQDGIPRQHLPGWSPSTYVGLKSDAAKCEAIIMAFRHAWLAYERDAMGADAYHPISQNGSNVAATGGIGYTVVDALDTMLLMGLNAEYRRARDWIEHKLSFDRDADFNTFETTTRLLGGLLSAHHHSGGDALYLTRARDLADRILPTFDTPSGLPLSMVNLHRRKGVSAKDNGGLVSTAEVSALQLEFRYLAELTDDHGYWKTVERVMALIRSTRMHPGLASIFMDPHEGRFVTSAIRLGSGGNSYYEYLLKQFIQTDRTEGVYREMYEDAVQGIHDHLIQKSLQSGLTYTAELIPEPDPHGEVSWRLTPKQDFLVCFLGGNLLLSATRAGTVVHDGVSVPPRAEELSDLGRRDWATGIELIRTCMATHETQTGLAPEIAHFRIPSDSLGGMRNIPGDWYIKGARAGESPPYDARYMLRPETVESLFIAFRLTGDKRYRDHGWAIFQAIEKHCRIPSGGYATIINVDEVPVQHEDKMETFFLSETLKYLFLLFSDGDTISLSKYVFNGGAPASDIYSVYPYRLFLIVVVPVALHMFLIYSAIKIVKCP